jgi:hypothetical protein
VMATCMGITFPVYSKTVYFSKLPQSSISR